MVRPVEVRAVRETSSLPPLIRPRSLLEEIGTKNERIHEKRGDDRPRGESMHITITNIGSTRRILIINLLWLHHSQSQLMCKFNDKWNYHTVYSAGTRTTTTTTPNLLTRPAWQRLHDTSGLYGSRFEIQLLQLLSSQLMNVIAMCQSIPFKQGSKLKEVHAKERNNGMDTSTISTASASPSTTSVAKRSDSRGEVRPIFTWVFFPNKWYSVVLGIVQNTVVSSQ